MGPTQTMVYCYTWQTHPLPIWLYQGDTPLLQSSKHQPVILASIPTLISLQEGVQISTHQDLQSHEGAALSPIPRNQKLCSDSPCQIKKIPDYFGRCHSPHSTQPWPTTSLTWQYSISSPISSKSPLSTCRYSRPQSLVRDHYQMRSTPKWNENC